MDGGPEIEIEEDENEAVKSRRDNLAKKPGNKKKLFEIYKEAQKAFEDQNGRSGEINDYWDIFNCTLGRNQAYSGDNELYIPAVYNAVEARVTRFQNQIFPTSGRHLEVISSDATSPRALTALGEHYIRRSKLRLVVPSLLTNGDVEGHYWVYVSWATSSRHVLHKVMQQVPGAIGEAEDVEEEEVYASHPVVEVLSDADVVVCPATADTLDDALNQGGSVTILRRWTEEKIDELIDEGLMDKAAGEAFIKEMSKKPTQPPSTFDQEKNLVSAAGIKGTGRGKHALVYETWTKKIDGKLTQTFFLTPDKIGHCHRNPLWCDRLPIIGHPARKVHGCYKGRSPISAVAKLQYYINDIAMQSADASNRGMCPIVLTDPMQNPRYDSMVVANGAVWKCDPNKTKILEFPQLWNDAEAIIQAKTALIMQTMSVNPAMMTQLHKSKPTQAEVAQEHAVDLLTTAVAVTMIEEGILTPVISLFMEMDHQYRDEAITVRAYGELGQEANMETIDPLQMNARYTFRWFGVEQARNAQQIQQTIAATNVIRGIPGEMYPEYVLDLSPALVNLIDSVSGPLQGRVIFQKVTNPQLAQRKALQMLLQKGQQMQAAQAGGSGKRPAGGGGLPKPGGQPAASRPAQNPPGAIHADRMGAPAMPRGQRQ